MPSCEWPIDRTCLPVADSLPDQVQQQHAEDLAVQVLWALSGRQFGVCPVIMRPCPPPCGNGTMDRYGMYSGVLSYFPIYDGGWRNISCGCGGTCTIQVPTAIHLAATTALPIQSVTEVVIAGEVLDPSDYRLEGDVLYRVSGPWPRQDLSKPLDEPGTWSVTYMRGTPPPPGTANLAALLAKEFLAACNGGKCRLPRNVQTVSRQGVTYQMIQPVDIYAQGKTGLPEVDLWLASVNPHRLASAPRVR